MPQQITDFRFRLRAPKSLLLLESCTFDDDDDDDDDAMVVDVSWVMRVWRNVCVLRELCY